VGFLHEEHDPPHGDTDEGYWQVHLAVDPLEKEAVQRIGPTVVPGEHLDLHTELIDGRDSDVVLTMKVFAKRVMTRVIGLAICFARFERPPGCRRLRPRSLATSRLGGRRTR
jgi:hypothetical protein